jgi:hypothetical protein
MIVTTMISMMLFIICFLKSNFVGDLFKFVDAKFVEIPFESNVLSS